MPAHSLTWGPLSPTWRTPKSPSQSSVGQTSLHGPALPLATEDPQLFQGCTAAGRAGGSVLLPLACPVPVMAPRSWQKSKLQPSLLHLVLKESSGCSGHSFPGGGWAGDVGLQGNRRAGVKVRSREGLPRLSAKRGNSSSKAWATGWSSPGSLRAETLGTAAEEQPQAPPRPCRPCLDQPQTGTPQYRRPRLREGDFTSGPRAILPHAGHQPQRPGGDRIYI